MTGDDAGGRRWLVAAVALLSLAGLVLLGRRRDDGSDTETGGVDVRIDERAGDSEADGNDGQAVGTDSSAAIESYEDAGGDHRFRLVGDETLAVSARGYPTREAALEAIERVRAVVPEATAVDA
jgi:uncharacterized protein YegP (UPF0339 family)